MKKNGIASILFLRKPFSHDSRVSLTSYSIEIYIESTRRDSSHLDSPLFLHSYQYLAKVLYAHRMALCRVPHTPRSLLKRDETRENERR